MLKGITPVYQPTPAHEQAMSDMGITLYRWINVLNGTKYENGEFIIDNHLWGSLHHSKLYNMIPHIVVGQSPHSWLEIPEDYHDIDWSLYCKSITATMDYIVANGHTEFILEVGNEMISQARHNWMVPDMRQVKDANGALVFNADNTPKMEKVPDFDHIMQDAYQNLYWHIAICVEEYEKAHPELKIKLIGWNSGYREHVREFCTKMGARKLDAVSFHSYALNVQFGHMIHYIDVVHKEFGKEVYITESGINAFDGETDPKIEAALYGAFLEVCKATGVAAVYMLIATSGAVSKSKSPNAIWKPDDVTMTQQGILFSNL